MKERIRRCRQRQRRSTSRRGGGICIAADGGGLMVLTTFVIIMMMMMSAPTTTCHAFVVPTTTTTTTTRDCRISSLLFARNNNNNNNNNKRRASGAGGQNHNSNHHSERRSIRNNNNVVVSSIRTNRQPQPVWRATTTTITSSSRFNVNRQFQSRFSRYEQDKLHGRQQQNTNNNNVESINNTRKPKKKATQQQQIDLSEKIRILLSDDDDDDDGSSPSSSSSFLESQTIADHETVFRKLSDEDKNQATFAVSKEQQQQSSSSNDDEIMLNHNKRRPKIRANVLETGQESMHHYYMKSMGQHQVLSMQDEQVLGRQIQLFNKWEETRQELEEELLRAPTFQEWADTVNTTVPLLKKQIRRSQQAKAALVEANLRLVVTVARQTVRQGRTEINFQDACQEGILGLTRASEKFDPEKGFRFSSYAVWWIKKRIHQSVTEQSRPMRLPPNVIRKINDIRIHEKVLQDELGRKPFDDEVASKVGMTVEQLEFYRKSANQVISLDKQLRFNKQSDNPSNIPTMHSMVKDPDSSPTELAQKQMLKDDVQRLILTLKPREQAVIRMRFGLDNGTPKTLQDIADKFSVDKEVVRKIEARALRKLRQPYRNQSLKSYIADL